MPCASPTMQIVKYDRDAEGRITRKYTSKAISKYRCDSYWDPGDVEDGAIENYGDGLVWHYEYGGGAYLPQSPTRVSYSFGVETVLTNNANVFVLNQSNMHANLSSSSPTPGSISNGIEFYMLVPSIAAFSSTTTWPEADRLEIGRPLVYSEKRLKNAFSHNSLGSITASDLEEVTYSYTHWTEAVSGTPKYFVKSTTRTVNAVPNGENGSNSATSTVTYTYRNGQVALETDATGKWTYFEYDGNGRLSRMIEDAGQTYASNAWSGSLTTTLSDFGLSTSALNADGAHLVTTYEYDNQDRLIKRTYPGRPDELDAAKTADEQRSEEFYYVKSWDNRKLTLSIPLVHRNSSGAWVKAFGPVRYTIENLAGKTEVDADIAFSGTDGSTSSQPSSWLATSGVTNPINAIATGTISRLSTYDYRKQRSETVGEETVWFDVDATGSHLYERRDYFGVPSGGGWPGTTSANFDATKYDYDSQGRLARITKPSGTVERVVRDFRGAIIERWIGTSDSGWDISHGNTNTGGGDMTKVEAFEYDSGFDVSDVLLAKRHRYTGELDPSSQEIVRTTEYIRDYRGRAIVEKLVGSSAPQIVRKYDNLNRVVAEALFDSAATLSASTDPTAASSSRLSLKEYFYDARGQVWKSITHRIVQATGGTKGNSVSGGELTTLYWRDPIGRIIKTDGTRLAKYRYDRLGQLVRAWTLAKFDDTSYSDVYDSGIFQTKVDGDIVLEQIHKTYDNSSGNVILDASISRSHAEPLTAGSGTLGDLNRAVADDAPLPDQLTGFSSAEVKGRIQITSHWFDDMDRQIALAEYGTAGFPDYLSSGSTVTFTRSSTVPSRSDDVLVTEATYDGAGRLIAIKDPKTLESRTSYDARGRVTSSIANYKTGSSLPADANQTVNYAYTNGLMTSMTAVMPSGQGGDQVTQYIYGTTKDTTLGGSPAKSLIATGHLLRETVYPPGGASTSTAQRTTHAAYNKLGEVAWYKDQNGTTLRTKRDAAGRTSSTSVDALGTGIDGDVRSIEVAFEARGMVSKVTQKNSTPSVTDEVTYSYDDYALLTSARQSYDGAVQNDSSDFVVGFTNERAAPTGGRVGVRRTGMTIPGSGGSSQITYDYAVPTSGADTLDNLVGRVRSVRVASGTGTIPVASYTYMGGRTVAGTTLDEPGVSRRIYGEGPAVNLAKVTGWDRFNRDLEDWWARPKEGSPTTAWAYAYRSSLKYDRNSNITLNRDRVVRGFDVKYVNDDLNRLTEADEGT
ncbi:MAG TPA: RHS repeat domain-containing protein, partial [Phycisphaerales bacterium]